MQRKLKGSSSKIPVNCRNPIKLYKTKMGGVDLMDQLKPAYQLDQKSMFRFYLRLFFDLFDVALVNSFIVYKKLENKDLILKEFKIYIALKFIALFVSQKTILSKPSSIQAHQNPKTRLDTTITFAILLGDKSTMYCMLPRRERKQNICYMFKMRSIHLPSKRKKLFFTMSFISLQ